MMQVYQIREEKRALIPAVTHVDGSGRLQTVYAHTNPRYHALISAFRDLTGVPMVLNTSLQRERTGGLHAGGGAGLLPADEDGCAGDGGLGGQAGCIALMGGRN